MEVLRGSLVALNGFLGQWIHRSGLTKKTGWKIFFHHGEKWFWKFEFGKNLDFFHFFWKKIWKSQKLIFSKITFFHFCYFSKISKKMKFQNFGILLCDSVFMRFPHAEGSEGLLPFDFGKRQSPPPFLDEGIFDSSERMWEKLGSPPFSFD